MVAFVTDEQHGRFLTLQGVKKQLHFFKDFLYFLFLFYLVHNILIGMVASNKKPLATEMLIFVVFNLWLQHLLQVLYGLLLQCLVLLAGDEFENFLVVSH